MVNEILIGIAMIMATHIMLSLKGKPLMDSQTAWIQASVFHC